MITDEYHKPTYKVKAITTTIVTRFTTATTTKTSTSTTTKPTTTISTTKTSTTTTKSTTTAPSTTTTTKLTTTTRGSLQVIRYCSGGFVADINGGVSTCLSDAYSNTPRLASELECIFPFNYKGTWIDSCITNDKGYYWCSLERYYTNKFAACNNYCPLLAQSKVKGTNYTHTSCLQISSNSGVASLFPSDQPQINLILDMHNQVRSNASYPNLNKNITTVYPSAADMRMIYWDVNLGRNAQKWVEYLVANKLFDHDCSSCRQLLNNQSIIVGQNLFAVSNWPYDIKTLWQWAILGAWFGEKSEFLYGGIYGSITGDFEKVGHYTQLITSVVSRVGCGVAALDRTYIVGCNYATGQTYPTQPYKSGNSCSSCSTNSNSCVNNLCTCNRYCQNYGTFDLANCKCICPPYTTGDECEIKLCNKTDQQYNCYKPDNSTYCMYANINLNCPHMCGYCTYII